MGSISFERSATRFRRTFGSSIPVCLFLLMAAAAQRADASFIGYYDPSSFTLTNSGGLFPNGYVASATADQLVLVGTNDGSGAGGATDYTIAAANDGLFQFTWLFNSFDIPTFEYAGYLVGGNFIQFADTDGETGSVMTTVTKGQIIGFRVGAFDNTGSPGVLTVTGFDAPAPPVPEPGGMEFMAIAFGAAAAFGLARRRSRRAAGPLLALALAILSLGVPARAQQISYSGTNVTGKLTLTNVVNLTQQAQPTMGAVRFQSLGSDNYYKTIPRLHPPLQANRMLGAQVAPPPIKGLTVSSVSAGGSFNGLSHADQRNADGGNQFSLEPPNQSIAVGNGYVLEGVNNAVQIYNISGSPQLPLILSANQVFGLTHTIDRTTGINGVFLTDMRVFYDQGINRWFVIMRSQDEDSAGDELNASHLYIAVSQTGDPTANYNIYIMETTNLGHVGCPCIDDYPQVGADQYGLHIAWNEFNTQSVQFVDAAILSISKSALGGGVSNPTAVQFFLPFASGFEYAIQPATTPPGAANYIANGGIEYFVSTLAFFAQGSQLGLWAMTNTNTLWTQSPNPTLARVAIPVLNYVSPDVATQPSGVAPLGTSLGAPTEFLDGGDARIQALSYASGRLYMTFQTGVTDENSHWVVGGAYVVLSPTYRNGVLAAQVMSEGYLVVNGNHLLRPAIAVNAQGNGSIGVTLSGSLGNYYPSAAYVPYQNGAAPNTLNIVAPGQLPEDGFSGYGAFGGDGVARWGDYNTSVADTSGTIWMVVQYIGNYPRTTLANWNTFVFHN